MKTKIGSSFKIAASTGFQTINRIPIWIKPYRKWKKRQKLNTAKKTSQNNHNSVCKKNYTVIQSFIGTKQNFLFFLRALCEEDERINRLLCLAQHGQNFQDVVRSREESFSNESVTRTLMKFKGPVRDWKKKNPLFFPSKYSATLVHRLQLVLQRRSFK